MCHRYKILPRIKSPIHVGRAQPSDGQRQCVGRQPIYPILSSLGLGRLVCRKRSANVCSHLALLVFARRRSWSLACRFLCTKQRSPFVLDEQRPHVCLSHLYRRSTKLSDVWTSALALLLICRRSRWLKPGQHNIGDRQET